MDGVIFTLEWTMVMNINEVLDLCKWNLLLMWWDLIDWNMLRFYYDKRRKLILCIWSNFYAWVKYGNALNTISRNEVIDILIAWMDNDVIKSTKVYGLGWL